MKHRKELLRWLIMVFVLLVIGGIVTAAIVLRDSEQAPQRTARAAAINVVTVAHGIMRETVRGIGTLQPRASIEIAPEIGGRLRTLHFEEGQQVQQGDLLVEIADEKLQQQLASSVAALRAAEARLSNAQMTFDRLENARQREAATQFEFDRARAELEAAAADIERYSAEVELVREQMTDTRIIAPFDGVISERHVDEGALLSVGQTIATLYDIISLEMSFGIPERHMGRVQIGQPVDVTVAAFPGRTFRGEVSFVGPNVREATRDFLVKAVIPNSELILKPGASATAVVVLDERADRTIIPEEALVGTRTGYIVFVVEDEIAHRREVQIGLRQDGSVEIVEGLSPGEIIVRTGHLRVGDGTPVRILNGPTPQPTTTASQQGIDGT